MEHSRLIDFIGNSGVEKINKNIEEKTSKIIAESDKNINNDNNKNNNNNKNNGNNNNNNNNNNNKNKKIIVADMMAGVGPFGVPLALKNITVYANDLNPASFKYLNINMKINHCEKHLKCYNMCGR